MNEPNRGVVNIDIESDYYKNAELLSATGSSHLVSNGMIEHAAVLSFLMLKKSKQLVKIATSKLAAELYTNTFISSAIQSALQNGVKITFLVREDPDPQSLKILGGLVGRENLEVRKMGDVTLINDFAVFDDNAFRFEEVNSHNAVASFNRPDLVSKLLKKFDLSLSGSSVIALTAN